MIAEIMLTAAELAAVIFLSANFGAIIVWLCWTWDEKRKRGDD